MKTAPMHVRGGITLLIAIAAFACGSGVTWLLMRPADAPAPVPSQQPPALAAPGGGASNVVENSNPAPPDVSQLPAAQSAVALGNWNYDNKNWRSAIEYYQRAIALGADNPDVRTDLGNAFRFSGNAQKALEQYQVAQRENPQHENSLFNAATLYGEVLNDPVNAANFLREYLRRFPNGDKAVAARKYLEEALAHPAGNAQSAGLLLQKSVPQAPAKASDLP